MAGIGPALSGQIRGSRLAPRVAAPEDGPFPCDAVGGNELYRWSVAVPTDLVLRWVRR
jgi:hypothetical protein